MSKYKTNPNPPSELFVKSLMGGGSHNINCGFCGREHYCVDSDSIYEDDLEEYRKNAQEEHKKDPEGIVIHYDTDFVETKDLNGMTFVVDCPCNGLSLYEKFIWADRNSIRRYLGERVRRELEFAEQEQTKNKLAGIEPDPIPTSQDIWTGLYGS